MWDVFSSTSQQHLIPDNYHNQYLRIYKRGNEQHFLSSRNAARFSTSAWQGDLYRVTHGRPQHPLQWLRNKVNSYISSILRHPLKFIESYRSNSTATIQCWIEATWLLFGTCLLFGSCHFHKYEPWVLFGSINIYNEPHILIVMILVWAMCWQNS